MVSNSKRDHNNKLVEHLENFCYLEDKQRYFVEVSTSLNEMPHYQNLFQHAQDE
jgi:hypothetical protein